MARVIEADSNSEVGGNEATFEDPELEGTDADRVRIDELPPLPPRSRGYYTEPLLGTSIVVVISALLVAVVHGLAGNAIKDHFGLTAIMVLLIWVEALIAISSMLYLFFGNAGVINRSPSTCYPMPLEVKERLRRRAPLSDLPNLAAPADDPEGRGTYCVRCLVWRPAKAGGKVHHCNTCQRCVRGFDHHCGVFGRCIVRRNMPCFFALIAMMFAGLATTMIAVTAGGSNELAR